MSYSSNRRVRRKFGRRIRPYIISGIALVGIVGVALSVFQRIGAFDGYLDRKALRDAMVGRTAEQVLDVKTADTRSVADDTDTGSNTDTADGSTERREIFAVADIPHDAETYGAIMVGSEAFAENAPGIAGALSLLGDAAYDSAGGGTPAGGFAGSATGGGMKVALADVWVPKTGGGAAGGGQGSQDGTNSGGTGSNPQAGGASGPGGNPGGSTSGGSGPEQTASLPSGNGGQPDTAPETPATEQPSQTANTGGGGGASGPGGNPAGPQQPTAGNTPQTPAPTNPAPQNTGPTNTAGGDNPAPGPVVVADNETLGGTDPVDGDLIIEEGGTHSPGHSPGLLEVSGDYILNGLLEIEIAGTDPGTGYDQIIAEGDAILDGMIRVSLLDGFVPDVDDVFDIIIADTIQLLGGFSIELPDLPGNFFFDWMLVELADGRMAFRIIDPPGAPIPGPAAGIVFLSGLGLLVAIRRRKSPALSDT